MRGRALPVGALVLAAVATGAAVGPTEPAADYTVITPTGVCASLTLLAAPLQADDAFVGKACNTGVNWLTLQRSSVDVGVAFNVATPRATMHCVMPPADPVVNCDWPQGNVPAVPGGFVRIDVHITSANNGAGAVALTFLGPSSL